MPEIKKKPGRPRKYDYDIHVKGDQQTEDAIEHALKVLGSNIRSDAVRLLVIKGHEMLKS